MSVPLLIIAIVKPITHLPTAPSRSVMEWKARMQQFAHLRVRVYWQTSVYAVMDILAPTVNYQSVLEFHPMKQWFVLDTVLVVAQIPVHVTTFTLLPIVQFHCVTHLQQQILPYVPQVVYVPTWIIAFAIPRITVSSANIQSVLELDRTIR